MDNYHTTVLLEEAIAHLHILPKKKYIDATMGGGGHTEEIAKRGGLVLGIDADEEAIEHVKEKFKIHPSGHKQNLEFKIEDKLRIVQGNFRDIDRLAKENGFDTVSGILFDLGVSGHQLDRPERGFSLRQSGPLDMRMDSTLSVRAGDLINGLSKSELSDLFFRLGEENQSRVIAKNIVDERKKGLITTTEELRRIVERTVRGQVGHVHPATRIFQALRIAVNDELHSLKDALPKAFALLEPGGYLAIISFHSLEDRIVKEYFLTLKESSKGEIITHKPVIPSEHEIAVNPRSRSAKLRVVKKI